MRDAIREDVQEQVATFIERLRATFDPDAYGSSADGTEFDTRLAELDGDFERMKRLFNDYLMAHWSDEIERSLQSRLESQSQGKTERGKASQDDERG